ncbi:DUF3592 domain-containing protein [Falsiroseomonas sp. HW251]|uniref:DUF3592 domain-containing protein n=1 Tax=Falsiroseomonas sp. HW251 TaxID=3390998 RepID=UPI003D31DC05
MKGPLSRWIYLAFLGGLALLFGWFTWASVDEYRALFVRGVQTEAVVAGYEDVRGKYGWTHYPIFRFAVDGRQVEGTSRVGADPAELRRGQRVKVVYDPAAPTHVRHAAALAEGMGATPWVTGILALLCLGVATLFLLPARTRR